MFGVRMLTNSIPIASHQRCPKRGIHFHFSRSVEAQDNALVSDTHFKWAIYLKLNTSIEMIFLIRNLSHKGNHQSMILMKVILSACVRNFKFTTNLKMINLEQNYEVTLKLVNKHMVSIERRIW